MTNHPLTIARAEAFRDACADRGPIAFVAVVPQDDIPGINGALGVAIANERGYHPVSLGWARFDTMDAAQDCADEINAHLHGDNQLEALKIIASTMGGRRYTRQAA